MIPTANARFLEALDEALSADAEDEAAYDLLFVTFDEDEGEVIERAKVR